MARGVTLVLDWPALPIYSGAFELAKEGVTCAGSRQNRAAYRDRIEFAVPPMASWEEILFDPQTSGGLLCAVRDSDAGPAVAALQRAGIPAVRVGVVVAERPRPLELWTK